MLWPVTKTKLKKSSSTFLLVVWVFCICLACLSAPSQVDTSFWNQYQQDAIAKKNRGAAAIIGGQLLATGSLVSVFYAPEAKPETKVVALVSGIALMGHGIGSRFMGENQFQDAHLALTDSFARVDRIKNFYTRATYAKLGLFGSFVATQSAVLFYSYGETDAAWKKWLTASTAIVGTGIYGYSVHKYFAQPRIKTNPAGPLAAVAAGSIFAAFARASYQRDILEPTPSALSKSLYGLSIAAIATAPLLVHLDKKKFDAPPEPSFTELISISIPF